MYASIIEEYLNTTKYTLWSILSILQYIESNHGLSIDNVSILEDEIYARLHHHQQRPNVQQRAIDKLRTLLKDQHQWFNTIEVESFMDELQKKEEKESDDENASDIASESDIFHSDVEEKMHELLIRILNTSNRTWMDSLNTTIPPPTSSPNSAHSNASKIVGVLSSSGGNIVISEILLFYMRKKQPQPHQILKPGNSTNLGALPSTIVFTSISEMTKVPTPLTCIQLSQLPSVKSGGPLFKAA
ncbi:hypothetical protein G9A89_006056 [Geosiphon pyriformis]|nr:hypothetical protein G9A89_006056 [Geosiphon pyriformis]